MYTILRLLALLSVGLLAACGETTIQGTGTGTQVNPITGQTIQTQQNIDVRAKRTGIGAPSAGGLLNTMTGANASGGGYGYGGYGVPYQSSGIPGFGGYIPGTTFAPDGSAICSRRKPSGAFDCGIWFTPAPSYYGGGGGYYGSGQYYYNPRTGTQQQDIRPGFKVN